MPEIDAFLDSLPADDREIVAALRHVVRRTVPEAEESVLWGSLSYHRPGLGGRVKGAVCLIAVNHGEVHLDFIHGVMLPDPRKLLRGARKSKRFAIVRTARDVHDPGIAALIRSAADYDPSQPP
jgi:hypothetical protein